MFVGATAVFDVLKYHTPAIIMIGAITTSGYVLFIASVSRTNGWVNGNLEKNVASGAGVTRTYEIGDASNYTPSTVVFLVKGFVFNSISDSS